MGRVGAGHHGPFEVRRGLEESNKFGLVCVDLHTILDAPFLADI